MNPVEASIVSLVATVGSVALEKIGDRVKPEHFEDESAREIMADALTMHGDGKFVAIDTLPKKHLEVVASVVSEHSSSMAYADHYVEQLQKLTKWRKAQRLAKELEASTEDSDFDHLFLKAIAELEDIEDGGEAVSDVREALSQTITKIETEITSTRGLLGFKTGCKQVSTHTQGFQKGQLWILGANPCSGKSLLAQSWARNAMVGDDAHVHVVSLEMSKQDWMRRFIQAQAGLNINEAVMSKDPSAIGRMSAAASIISKFPFSISDKGGISLYTLKRQLKSEVKKGKNFFILDHLGLLDHGGKEIEGYKKTTSWLKAFAKKQDVFVLVICQLNSKGEEETMAGKPPRLGHIAYGSSGPNQDADVVFIMTMDQELYCCKNRNGLMNWSVQMEMDGSLSRIKESAYAE